MPKKKVQYPSRVKGRKKIQRVDETRANPRVVVVTFCCESEEEDEEDEDEFNR